MRLILLATLILITGCTNITITLPPEAKGGGTYYITVSADKNIPFTASPSGNTVPLTGVP